MVQCKTCGGTYAPTLADGLQYFHRCPPLSAAELTAAVAAGKVVLPLGETPDVAILRRVYERANLRDENLVDTTAANKGAIKSAGTNTTPSAALPPAPVIVPVLPVIP